MRYFFLIIACSLAVAAGAQADPEFPKGFIFYGQVHSGVQTRFNSQPDLYILGLQALPQVTVVPGILRAGAVAGVFYADKKMQTHLGPQLRIKLKSLKAGSFGTAGNLQLSLDHMWASQQQRLLGAGIHLDLLNKLVLGITAHRDYAQNRWWLQSAVAIRLSKRKKTSETFND